jgi:RES domain-containing protein
MFVYRIAKEEQISLDGRGGLFGPGRWHRKGNLVIYTSEHASLAAWEKLVHLVSLENLPNDMVLAKIEIPENEEILTVPQQVLVKGWDGYPFSAETQNFGTSFLRSKSHLALKIPSVVIPGEYNILLNPLHQGIQQCRLVSTVPFVFDKRISKLAD